MVQYLWLYRTGTPAKPQAPILHVGFGTGLQLPTATHTLAHLSVSPPATTPIQQSCWVALPHQPDRHMFQFGFQNTKLK